VASRRIAREHEVRDVAAAATDMRPHDHHKEDAPVRVGTVKKSIDAAAAK
jgi:hypothetical protein